MELENKLQKQIGIFLSIIIMSGVLFTTVFLGKKSTNTPPSNQNSSNNIQIPPTTSQNPISPNPITTTTPTPVIVPKPPVAIPPKSTYVYNNGTYSATGSYMSPGGYDQIGISITINSDIITATSATNMAGDGRSQRYEDTFIANYRQYVIGQNIANVYLTKVSGASLTPQGFNDALNQIKIQAKA